MITAGIDVGSLTAKAIIYDSADDCILGRALLCLAHDPAAAGQAVFAAALQDAALSPKDVSASTGTGYGRISLDFVDFRITEISCHACGVHRQLPEARTVLDIGGQDCKAIALDDEGRALDFEMNDRCAAGTGRFLEVMAGALGTDLSGMVKLALESTKPETLSSTCTVFAESEVIGLLAQGADRANVAAGLCRAVAQRVVAMTGRLTVRPQVALTGGVALNEAVRTALQAALQMPVIVPEDPQLTGALGAALLAAERSTTSP